METDLVIPGRFIFLNEEESPSIISKQAINGGWIFSNKAKESATETILVSLGNERGNG